MAAHRPVIPAATLASLTIIVALLVLTGSPSPVRGIVVAVFVLLAPGWALLDIWDLTEGWIGISLAVAISVSLATLVPLILFYLGDWSADAALLVLALLTLSANAVSLRRHTRAGNPVRT